MVPTAFVAAQFAGTLELLDTTRIAARHTEPAVILAGQTSGRVREVVVAADALTAPVARVRVVARRWDWALTYSPSITAPDTELGVNLQLMQSGAVTAGWHDRFTRVTVSETASYGQLNSALLYPQAMPGAPGQPPPVLQAAPNPTTIDFGSSNTSAGLFFRSGRRTSVSLWGGYQVSGGVNGFSQTYLPKQTGPVVQLSLGYAASRLDALTTQVTAQETDTTCAAATQTPQLAGTPPTPCRQRAPIAQLAESVVHRLSASATVSAGLGIAATIVWTPSEEDLVLQPVASATYTRRFSADIGSLVLNAQLAPVVDVRTGLANEELQARAALTRRMTSKVAIEAGATAQQTIPIPQSAAALNAHSVSGFGGNLEVRVALDRQVDLSIGAQELWQRQEGFGTFSSTIGYVGVTGRAPTLRF